MTREEAIENLNTLYMALAVFPNQQISLGDVDKMKEAVSMSITTLLDEYEEPKKGHWIFTLEDWSRWECSECGFTKRTDVHIKIGYKYCPNCGCRMENEENDSHFYCYDMHRI